MGCAYLYITDQHGTEWEYVVPYDAEPYVPAKTNGPPECCYPEEGGFAVVAGEVEARNPDSGKTVERISEEELYRRYAEDRASLYETRRKRQREIWLETWDREPPERNVRTDLQYAQEDIEAELWETHRDEVEDDYYAAAEAKYDMLRDEGLV